MVELIECKKYHIPCIKWQSIKERAGNKWQSIVIVGGVRLQFSDLNVRIIQSITQLENYRSTNRVAAQSIHFNGYSM